MYVSRGLIRGKQYFFQKVVLLCFRILSEFIMDIRQKKNGWFVKHASYQSIRLFWEKTEFFSSVFLEFKLKVFQLLAWIWGKPVGTSLFVSTGNFWRERAAAWKTHFCFICGLWLKTFRTSGKNACARFVETGSLGSKKYTCRIIFRKFLNFFDNSSCERLVLSFVFFFGFSARKFLDKSSRAEFSKVHSTCSKIFLEKTPCSKSSLFFLKSFSDIERCFFGHRQKTCALFVKTSLQVFRRSFWRKKIYFFPILLRIEQKDSLLPSKQLGSVIVTSFCLSRGGFQRKTFFSKKAVFLQCRTLGENFYWRWRKNEGSSLKTAFYVSRWRFSWKFFAMWKLFFLCFPTLSNNYRSLVKIFWRSCQNCMVDEKNLRKRVF